MSKVCNWSADPISRTARNGQNQPSQDGGFANCAIPLIDATRAYPASPHITRDKEPLPLAYRAGDKVFSFVAEMQQILIIFRQSAPDISRHPAQKSHNQLYLKKFIRSHPAAYSSFSPKNKS
ncbi:MAG: hypothetical protein QM605_04435 [Sphingobium sp.]